jgi:BASS family bile acid:Na+ symporter
MGELLNYLLPISIGVMMFGIGLNLELKDFKRVFTAPKAILFGLFGQLVILPLIGFGIASIFDISPIYKLGIVLIAACPGGTSSNIMTYMLNGRVALSVSITAFNSFIIVLTIPLILSIAFETFLNQNQQIDLSINGMLLEVEYTVLLPVLLGSVIHYYFWQSIEKFKSSLRYILPALLFLVFLLVLLNEHQSGDLSLAAYGSLIFPAFLLNIVVMFVGFFLSGWIGIGHSGKFTIAIEMGLQNSALAIFLANSVLQIEGLAVIAVLYGGFSFFSTLIIAYIMKKWMNKENVQP